MTPLVFLIGFCLVMGAIAIGRVAVGNASNPTDAGSALIIFGVTALSAFWVVLEESLLTPVGGAAIALLGTTLAVVGLVAVVRRWDEPTRA